MEFVTLECVDCGAEFIYTRQPGILPKYCETCAPWRSGTLRGTGPGVGGLSSCGHGTDCEHYSCHCELPPEDSISELLERFAYQTGQDPTVPRWYSNRRLNPWKF